MSLNGEQLTIIEQMIVMIEKYGWWKIIKATLFMLSLAFILFNIANLKNIVSDVIDEQNESEIIAHDTAMDFRRSIKEEIDGILNNVLTKTNADRVFVLELHNGTNNTAGLPFIYAEMTYCAIAENIHHIDEDYINLNLSRFNFPLYLERNKYFYGDIEKLKKVDDKLALRLQSNGARYIAIMSLQGLHTELGYIGVTFCNDEIPADSDGVMSCIALAAQRLSTLLDKQ